MDRDFQKHKSKERNIKRNRNRRERKNNTSNLVESAQSTQSETMFQVPYEIWHTHILVDLDRRSLANLRLSCSFFRKKILFCSPYWEQWIPYDQIINYREIGWEGKPYSRPYGIIISGAHHMRIYKDQFMPTVEFFRDFTRNAIALEFLTHCDTSLLDSRMIEGFPSTLQYLSLNIHPHDFIEKSLLKAIYRRFPKIIIRFQKTLFGRHESFNALYYTSELGYSSVVKMILQNPDEVCTINIKHGFNHQTPLLIACRSCNYEVVDILLQHGADPNLCGADGKSPLMYACEYGKLDIVQTMLRYRPKIFIQDDYFKSAFDYARGKNDIILALNRYEF